MTKLEAINLFTNLNKLGEMSGVKFAYAVSKNLGLLKSEIESLDKARIASKEYQEFDALRIKMVEKHAKKGKDGKPIMKDNVYEIENQMAVDKEFEALKLEHKEVFDARIKQIDEFNELLKTDSSVVLYTIPLSYVPEGITVAQMYSIALIINEEIPSPYKDKV